MVSNPRPMRRFIAATMVITVIIFVVLAIVWVAILKKQTTIPIPPGFTQAGFGMRCSDIPATVLSGNPEEYTPQECESGLVCVKRQTGDVYGTCLKGLGVQCVNLLECVPQANYCVGVCSTTQSGGVGQYCSTTTPCSSPDLECVKAQPTDPVGVCKITSETTTPCIFDDQCVDGYCVGGLCKTKAINGQECGSNRDCASGYCDTISGGGYCQNVGVSTGTTGAACRIFESLEPQCDTGLICTTDFKTATQYIYGTCERPVVLWPDIPCDETTACIPPTICFGGKCVLPRIGTTLKINACDAETTGVCAGGFTCISGTCNPNSGSPAMTGQYGIAEWIPGVSGSGSIGHWQRIPITGPIATPTVTAELTSLEYATGKLYMYFRTPSSFTFATSGSNWSSTITPDMTIYNVKTGGVTSFTPQVTYTFTGVTTQPINIGSGVRLIKTSFDLGGTVSFHFMVNGQVVNDSGPVDRYRVVILPIPDDWFTTTPTTNVAVVNPTQFQIGGSLAVIPFYPHPTDAFTNFLPVDMVCNSQFIADGAIIAVKDSYGASFIYEFGQSGTPKVSELNQLINGEPTVYSGVYLLSLNQISPNTATPPTTITPPFIGLVAPYNFNRYGTNLNSGILILNGSIRLIVDANLIDETIVPDTPYFQTPIDVSEFPGQVSSFKVSYNPGAVISQLNIAYTWIYSGVTYVRYVSSGEDRILPGFFSSTSLTTMSIQYINPSSVHDASSLTTRRIPAALTLLAP